MRAATVSNDLKRATGYTASQLTTRPVCGAPQPGSIRCLANELTVKSTGRVARRRESPSISAASTPLPEFTADYLQFAYDTTWLSLNHGASDTVAIVDAYGDPTAYSDMQQFRSANRLQQVPTCGGSVTTSCFEAVNEDGQTSPLPGNSDDETGGWNVEESLDIDAVSSLCPLCKILMVEANSDDSYGSPDLETAVSTASQMGANQISLSWGGETTPDASAWESPFGHTSSILAASGDSAYQGPDVQYPAALSNVTAVGGTSLSTDLTTARGFDESTWAIYSCTDGSCGTGSGCDNSQSVPSYQSGVTTECSGRAYNDISADADPQSGLQIYDSQAGSEGCGTSTNTCIVGGTSLATPLVAAFEAITGISGANPAWAYGDEPLLNDIVSGSNGTCPSGKHVICNAGTGWDGPTGNGSIDGDVVTGGPGIGAQPAATNITTSSASVSGYVDPNDSSPSADTTYQWQYGTTTGYGSVSAAPTPLTAGTAFESATGTLSLADPCVYHYRLTATNAIGTTEGYDQTLTPDQTTTVRVNTALPTITGTAAIGQQLTALPGTWSGGFDCGATTYQWKEASSSAAPQSAWTPITSATSSSYIPTTSDADEYLEVVVTETNAAASTSATSAPTSEVPAPPPPPVTPPTTSTPAPTPTPTTTTTTAVEFYRCLHTCTLINTHGASTYKPTEADYGRFLEEVTTVTTTTGTKVATSVTTRWVGPITAATAGDVSIGSGARIASVVTVRGSTGKTLARVTVTKHGAGKLTLTIRRATSAKTQVWAYVVSKGAYDSGTQPHSVGKSVKLTVSLKSAQTIKLVAVST